VSWLLVALIPGLLMLATFGLERLEAGIINESADSAKELADLIDAAAPGTDHAYRPVPRRPEPDFPTFPPLRTVFGTAGGTLDDEPGLPTRHYARANANPQFQATRQANRV
jgi:hypothetical protein